jgi:DNA repair exonuclease SbcCD ATPase subunit/DNA repair exonuclease SbcCD nuclease subunit
MEILKKDIDIETIYHISDIHVMKNNTRDTEYEEVFEELYKKLSLKKGKSLIVCTGDIFDNGLSPTAIVLVKNLFVKLSKISDIIVIRGNHDGSSRSNSESIDYLFPILYKLKTQNNVYLLGKTGAYEYGNIIFGYTDYYDKNVFKIEEEQKDNVKIGLWHGTISGSLTDANNIPLEGPFNKESFECYDYVLLGDIHKHQYLDERKKIFYSGSLIQLNYGEKIKGHGYVELDLKKGSSKLIEVKNNYGFLTIFVKKNKVIKYDEDEVPKNINLRIIHEDTDENVLLALTEEMKKKYNLLSIVKHKREYYMDNMNNNQEKECEELVDNESSIKKLLDYIKKNKKELKEEEIKGIEKILREKMEMINYKYDYQTRDIKLKNIVFNNFNIYDEKNCVSFDDFKGIVNLSGPNGSGKSSIIHAILFCLYGECENISVSKYDYINSEKINMDIVVTINVNNIEYKIHRSCGYRGKKRNQKNFKSNVVLYENGKDISGKNLPTIENQIKEIFGTQDEFVRMCIMEQKVRKGFMDYNDNQKSEYICKILKLDLYNEICVLLDSDISGLKKEIKKNESLVCNNGNDVETEKKNILEEKEKANKELCTNEEEKRDERETINRKKIEIEMKLDELKEYDDAKKYEKYNEELQKKLKNILLEKMSIDKKIKDKKGLKEKNDKEIEKMQNIEEKNDLFQKERNKKMNEIDEEINKLSKQIINTEKKDNIEKIKKDFDEKEKEINNINKIIKENNEEIEKMNDDIKKYEKDKKNAKNYEKYTELYEKVSEINKEKKRENDKKEELAKIRIKKEKEYKKIHDEYKKCALDEEKIEEELKKDMYINIEEQKRNFDDNNNKKREMINKEIQEDLKNYVNQKEEIDIKKLQMKRNNLEKEIKKNFVELENKNKLIDENKKKVVVLNKKYDNDLDENNKQYLKLYDEIQTKYIELKKYEEKYSNYTSHYKLIKNHEYNEKCEVCMKNKLTVDLLNTQKKMEECKEDNKKIKKIITACEKQMEKYKKYNILYLEREEDIKSNAKIENEIEKEEKNIIILTEKNKNIIKEKDEIIKIMQDSENNKIIVERISVNNKKIQSLENLKFDAYEKYTENIQKLNDKKKSNEMLKLRMKDYENLLENIELIDNKISGLDAEYKKISKSYAEYEKYGEINKKYNENKINLAKKLNENELYKKKIEADTATIGLYNYKINEYAKYIEIEKKNDDLRKQIDTKHKIYKKYNDETYDDYNKYIKIKNENKNLELELSEQILNLNKLCFEEKEISSSLKENEKKMENITLMKHKKEELKKIQESYLKINEEIDSINKNKILLLKEITEIELEIKNIQKIKESNKDLDDELKNKIDICYIIRNGYVDNLLTNEIIPKFCEGVNEILSSFVNFRICMEYNNKKITLSKKDINDKISNASQLSGYESLMLEIALRMYINGRNKLQKINFFVIDEGFSFCDENSIQRIQYLFEFMRKLYSFTIVVSHNEQIKMYTDMDLQITTKNGKSKVYYTSEKNKENINKCFELFQYNLCDTKQLTDENDDTEATELCNDTKNKDDKKFNAKKIKKIVKKINYKDINKKSKILDDKLKKGKQLLNQSDSEESSD